MNFRLGLILALCLCLMNCSQPPQEESPSLHVYETPPVTYPFEKFWDLATLFDQPLSSGKDFLVLVYISELGCRTCMLEVLEWLAQQYPFLRNDFDFALVTRGLSVPELRSLRRARLLVYPAALDNDNQLKVSNTPSVFLVEVGQNTPALSYQPDITHDLDANLTHFFKRARARLSQIKEAR